MALLYDNKPDLGELWRTVRSARIKSARSTRLWADHEHAVSVEQSAATTRGHCGDVQLRRLNDNWGKFSAGTNAKPCQLTFCCRCLKYVLEFSSVSRHISARAFLSVPLQ